MKRSYLIKEQVVIDFLNSFDGNEKILIYGAGNVAKRLCGEFEKSGKLNKIKAFIVYSKKYNPNDINGIPVEEYTDFISESEKIVIGLWETKQQEIYFQLVKNGINEERIIRLPCAVNQALEFLYRKNKEWEGSEKYWNDRYKSGGNSGTGSYNRLAEFKAKTINDFVKEHKINSVIEWGCGDGNQLSLLKFPHYVGYDVSEMAVELCRKKFVGDSSKKFLCCKNNEIISKQKADLVLSLDVIYHLVENEIYETYMERLFASSDKYVCIYSCDYDDDFSDHVRCRKFTKYIEEKFISKGWRLDKVIRNIYPYNEKEPENTSWSDFYIYQKI